VQGSRGRASGRYDQPPRHRWPGRFSLGHSLPLGYTVAIVLAFVSCGLESIPYYDPPIVQGAYETDTAITFYHDTNNGQDFLGYDLYYRFYANKTNAETALSKIAAMASSTSMSPDQVYTAIKATYNFKPIVGMSSNGQPIEHEPLFLVPSAARSTSIQYIMTFTQIDLLGNWTVYDSYSRTSIDIVRSKIDSATGLNKSFNGDFVASASGTSGGDEDYDGSPDYGTSLWTDRDTALYLVAFAVGKGQDPQNIWLLIPSMPASFGVPLLVRGKS
jgi:hypothetical protein